MFESGGAEVAVVLVFSVDFEVFPKENDGLLSPVEVAGFVKAGLGAVGLLVSSVVAGFPKLNPVPAEDVVVVPLSVAVEAAWPAGLPKEKPVVEAEPVLDAAGFESLVPVMELLGVTVALDPGAEVVAGFPKLKPELAMVEVDALLVEPKLAGFPKLKPPLPVAGVVEVEEVGGALLVVPVAAGFPNKEPVLAAAGVVVLVVEAGLPKLKELFELPKLKVLPEGLVVAAPVAEEAVFLLLSPVELADPVLPKPPKRGLAPAVLLVLVDPNEKGELVDAFVELPVVAALPKEKVLGALVLLALLEPNKPPDGAVEEVLLFVFPNKPVAAGVAAPCAAEFGCAGFPNENPEFWLLPGLKAIDFVSKF